MKVIVTTPLTSAWMSAPESQTTLSIVIESRFTAEGVRDLDLFVDQVGIALVPADLEQGT
jgi:hypothetical protein